MSHLMHAIPKRLVRLVMAGGLLTGAVAAPLLLTGGTAQAALCSAGSTPAGTPCTLTGTLSLTSGSLSLTAPGALGWTAADTGLDLNLVDTGHTTYGVNDATGSGAGWHVTTSATTFTNSATTPASTLPSTSFTTNGSTTSTTSTTGPGAVCATGATCLPPTNKLTGYPYTITTAASPTAVTVWDANALSGLGSITIGTSGAPVGWWLNVPASTVAGSYTSTITMNIISGP
jgi:hypothetical protein